MYLFLAKRINFSVKNCGYELSVVLGLATVNIVKGHSASVQSVNSVTKTQLCFRKSQVFHCAPKHLKVFRKT